MHIAWKGIGAEDTKKKSKIEKAAEAQRPKLFRLGVLVCRRRRFRLPYGLKAGEGRVKISNGLPIF